MSILLNPFIFRAPIVPPNLLTSAIAANNCQWPLTYQNNTNTQMQYIKRRWVPIQIGGDGVRILLSNYSVMFGGEITTGHRAATWRGQLKYNGVFYPVTFNGTRDVSVPLFGNVWSDPIAGLTLPESATVIYFEEYGRWTYAAGNGIPYGNYQNARFGELICIDSTSNDWTDGSGWPQGASVTVTLSSGTITDVQRLTAGSGFVGGNGIAYATEVRADGSVRDEAIATFGLSGTGIDSFRVLGTGAAMTGWTAPTYYVKPNAGTNGVTANQPCHAASLIVITNPSNQNYKNVGIFGDSISAASAADTFGDRYGNYSNMARAILNNSGIVNIATPGADIQFYDPNASFKYTRTYAALQGLFNRVIIAGPTNDFVNGAVSLGMVTGWVNSIRTYFSAWRSCKAQLAAVIPRTNSSNVPLSGFAIGEKADQYNINCRTGVIPSDLPFIDGEAVYGDPADRRKWRSDVGAGISALTTDYVHPNAGGGGAGAIAVIGGVAYGAAYYFRYVGDLRQAKGVDRAIATPVCNWDSALTDSYPGSGQTIFNIINQPIYVNTGITKGDYDGFLGDSESVNAFDPTYVPAAGGVPAYFTNDGGDYFSHKTKTAVLNALHKTTGATDWSIGIALRTDLTNASSRSFFKSADTILAAHYGINIENFSGIIDPSQRGDSARSTGAFAGMPSGVHDYLIIFSYNSATGQLTRFINSSTGTTTAWAFNTTANNIGETYNPQVFKMRSGDIFYDYFLRNSQTNGFEAGLLRNYMNEVHAISV